jgi:hypothetical protein
MRTVVCVLALCCALGRAALTADDYPGGLMDSLVNYAGMGLNWSDAHIGNFPRGGGGLSLGLVSAPLKDIAVLAKAAGADAGSLDAFAGITKSTDPTTGSPVMLMPVYVLEGRIGGFFLPFDVGVKLGFIPDLTGKQMVSNKLDSWFNFFLWGVDFRYAVLQEGRILPKVSVGVGYNGLSGGLGLPIAGDPPQSFNVAWQTDTIEVKAHVSKTVWLLTPYLGGSGGIAMSKVSHTAAGVTTPDGDAFRGFGRIFLGVSANGAVAALDLQFALTVPTVSWSVTLGLRVVY